MSIKRFASTYRNPSSASVQPRAPMGGGTYGTLSRRPSPGMNSAAPFGYQATNRPGMNLATPFGYPAANKPGGVYQRLQMGQRNQPPPVNENLYVNRHKDQQQESMQQYNQQLQQMNRGLYGHSQGLYTQLPQELRRQMALRFQQQQQQNPYYNQMRQLQLLNTPGHFNGI